MGDVIALAALPFPEVPEHLQRRQGTFMEPCPDVAEWASSMFMTVGSKFYNPTHKYLDEYASIGFVWTNVENASKGKVTAGTAQLGDPSGGTKWAKARQYEQLSRWFGYIPDFLITLDSVYMSVADPRAICAVIEHELCHCAPKRNKYGEIEWDEDDRPRWMIRKHDIEEFFDVIRLYGAWNKDLVQMRDALNATPKFGEVDLRGICCGVCNG